MVKCESCGKETAPYVCSMGCAHPICPQCHRDQLWDYLKLFAGTVQPRQFASGYLTVLYGQGDDAGMRALNN